MLTIRKTQISTVGEAYEREFVAETVKYLQQHHPRHTEPLETSALEQIVKSAVERSRVLGCDVGEPPARIAELMLFFGPGFESEQPWAQQIAAEGVSEPLGYVDRLYEAGIALIEVDS